MGRAGMFPFNSLFPDIPEIHIADIGASPIEGQPVYKNMLQQGGCRLTCFEPSPEMFVELVKQPQPNMTCLPYAIGDGQEATLNICAAPGMTSLLEPDLDLLGHFHGFAEWGQVVRRLPMRTHRLDDLQEVPQIDFIKLDVQGSELAILENGPEQLKRVLVVHVETLFVPFYKNQPLFGEIDTALRRAGFLFHKFGDLVSRVFQPLVLNNDPYAGLSQVLWSDSVYVRAFPTFQSLPPADLLKLARLMHDIYASVDMANLALLHYDRQAGTNRRGSYLQRLTGKS